MPFLPKFGFTSIGVFFCFCGFARQHRLTMQADTFQTQLKSALINYYKKYPQEKVFLHTNQAVYSGGQTIWYKIYAMAYGKPDLLSKIIYVQLTDTAGHLVIQHKLPLEAGKAHGNIDIDPKLKSGWYQISAFTSWMINFDHDARFHQKFYIRNPSDAGAVATEKERIETGYHISFYPEGGTLIAGNLNRIAFKAVSNDGLPAKIDGEIEDDANHVIGKLITQHDGMGEFYLEPIKGNLYSATVNFPDGSKKLFKLPDADTVGMSLEVSQDIKFVHLNLASAGAESCLLAAFQNNGVVNTYPIELRRGINEFKLPKSNFSTGILKFTLFDHNNLPKVERIVFINQHDINAAAICTDTLSFLPHGLNVFSLGLKDNSGQPLKGNFSIAITDGDAINDEISQNIFSALLLSPELKGEVFNPGYYFKNESDTLASQLDLVMLTNGWRHFTWQNVLHKHGFPFVHPVERSMFIAGKIEGYKNIRANKDGFQVRLLIMNYDSTKFIGYISPDTAGNFIVQDFNHAGLSDIYVQTADRKNHVKNLKVGLYSTLDDSLKQTNAVPFPDQAFPDLGGYFISHAQSEAKFHNFSTDIMLRTVTIQGKKITPVEKLIEEHVNSKYTSDREFTLDLVNNPSGVNIGIIDYIRGRFPNLQVLGDQFHPQFIYRGGNTLSLANVSSASNKGSASLVGNGENYNNPNLPYFYLNEAPVLYDDIADISLQEIALIRFIPPPVWFVPFNGGNTGAIMIYTKKQSDEVMQMTGMSNFDHFIFNGYSISREFSTPDPVQLKASGLLDDRITLYWNHDLESDNNGGLKFRFNNSAISKKFRVSIQGMDKEGRLFYMEQLLR